MRYASVVTALLIAAAACLGADQLPKATRVAEGAKATYPATSIPAGVKALAGVLESCSSTDDESYKADDVKKAKKHDHVRFVFPKPLQVKIEEKNFQVSEAVFTGGVFWLVCEKGVVRCAKYTHDKMEPLRKWYERRPPDTPEIQ